MPKNDFRTVNPDLEDVQQKFTSWREKRTRRRPIPEGLWEAAINLSRAKEYPINKIFKALRLNYSDLKRRISAHGKPIIIAGSGDIRLKAGRLWVVCTFFGLAALSITIIVLNKMNFLKR